MKALYIHGFNDEDNQILEELRSSFPELKATVLNIPILYPEQAVKLIQRKVKDYDLLIAHELGGLLSLRIKDIPKIIINISYSEDIEKIYPISNKTFPDKNWYINELKKLEPIETYKRDSVDYNLYSDPNTYFVFGEKCDLNDNVDRVYSYKTLEKHKGINAALDPFVPYSLTYIFDEDGLDIYENIIFVKGMKDKLLSPCKRGIKAINYVLESINNN